MNNYKLSAAEAFKLIKLTVNKLNTSNLVSHLCNTANVYRSGYYNYLRSTDRRLQREAQDLVLKDIILKAYEHRGYKRGSISIKMTLNNEFNIIYSRKRIQRIMHKYEIVCLIRKANPYNQIPKATKEHTVVPNILNRNFKQNTPGKVLLTDITYLPYSGGRMAYLSTIKDASTNKILAYIGFHDRILTYSSS